MSQPTNTISIPHLGQLANIPLTPEEEVFFASSLGSVIEFMQSISKIDLVNVAETTRTNEEENVLREDLVLTSFSQEEALQNAARSYQGYFLVPAILDKEE